MYTGSVRIIPFVLLILAGLDLYAQPGKSQIIPAGFPEESINDKRVVVHPASNRVPVIDGRLDDEIWRGVPFVSDFRQKDPIENADPSERTEVAFLYDEEALYIGARMFSRDPGQIRATVTRRDNAGTSERLIISLDTYNDKRTAYSFSVTAAGVRSDYYHPTDDEYDRDGSFDPVWEARTTIDDEGWTAEMRIPFSQLRFNEIDEQTWGINMNRWVPALNEDIYWVWIPKDVTGWSSRFAPFVGIRGIRPSSRIELLPYVAGDTRLAGVFDENDPFTDEIDMAGRAGLDLKMGLGPNLTLNATINPDFGQVEADPAEVNLTAYETFFAERRPFFVEGSQLLRGHGPSYFYSRRIGAAPHGSASGDYVERIDHTTILGAAKLTGRLSGGLSIGALAAMTDRESARTFMIDSAREDRVEVEPLTAYGVVRAQQEFGAYASTVGLTLTGVRRDLDGPLATLLAREAITGGGDWRVRFADGDYVWAGHAGFSHVGGDSLAIQRIQRSSAHYFQRPDASHVEFDPSATSLFGYTASSLIAKVSGRWLWEAELWVESPGLELNDIGRIGSTDNINLYGYLRYRETQPGEILRGYNVGLTAGHMLNFDGNHLYTDFTLDGSVTWMNFWTSNVGFTYNLQGMSDDLTRGGPLMMNAAHWYAYAGIGNSFASNTRWSVNLSAGESEIGFWSRSVSLDLSANIGDRLEVSLGPGYSRRIPRRQFIASIKDSAASTFGRRYIFSTVDQTDLSMQVRLNYALTPDLSLQLYAEPFVATGSFSDFGELAAPQTADLVPYHDGSPRFMRAADGSITMTSPQETLELGNPDYFIRSFRSNLVLRWEWRAGSTLFVVWQQDRSFYNDRVRSIEPGDLGRSITDIGDNVLAVKLTYWLPID